MRPSGLLAIAGVWMVAFFAMLLFSFPPNHHDGTGSNAPGVHSQISSRVRSINFNESVMDNSSMLFIHVPKAGGTTFTTILRELQCLQDPKMHSDCCRNPGSCYIKVYRRCISILGCVSHYPRRYAYTTSGGRARANITHYVMCHWSLFQPSYTANQALSCHFQRASGQVILNVVYTVGDRSV
jgi:hypothetical protein